MIVDLWIGIWVEFWTVGTMRYTAACVKAALPPEISK